MDSLFPRTRTCPVNPVLCWHTEVPPVVGGNGSPQSGRFPGREFREIFKICRRQGAGLNSSTFLTGEQVRNCSACFLSFQKVLLGFLSKITCISTGFWLKLGLEAAKTATCSSLKDKDSQQISFSLPGSVGGVVF